MRSGAGQFAESSPSPVPARRFWRRRALWVAFGGMLAVPALWAVLAFRNHGPAGTKAGAPVPPSAKSATAGAAESRFSPFLLCSSSQHLRAQRRRGLGTVRQLRRAAQWAATSPVTIESFGFTLGELSAAASIWRDLAPTPESVAFEGVKLLKSQLQRAGAAAVR